VAGYEGTNRLYAATLVGPPRAVRVVGGVSSATVICVADAQLRWSDGTVTPVKAGTVALVLDGIKGGSPVVFDRSVGTWIVYASRSDSALRVGRESDVYALPVWIADDFAVAGRVLYDDVVPYQYIQT